MLSVIQIEIARLGDNMRIRIVMGIWAERARITWKIFQNYSLQGVLKAFKNEKIVSRAIIEGKLGYCLFKGVKG